MASKPVINRKVERLYSIPGRVPNPIDLPDHCYFLDRCDRPLPVCRGTYPPLIQLSPTHFTACYNSGYEEWKGGQD
jgi:peptide/nickel transport system ATP-binding protein